LYLHRRVERFLKKSGMSATRFGLEAARDPRFVFDLRRGREPRLLLERRVAAWLDRQDPRLRRRRCSR
jgi:hypothetical protein